jgi:hypothetical protein
MAWASATVRPSRTISCRIVVNRSPRADSSMRRPASAPASIRATTMPADSDRTAYQSGDAPQGSTGSGSAPHASSSITSELPPRAWSKRSSTLSANGVVHGGGSTPSASSTTSVPSRLSPRSYHGHGPAPLAARQFGHGYSIAQIGRRGTQADAPPRRFDLLDVYIDRLVGDGGVDVVASTGKTGVRARERLPRPDGHHV